MKEDFADVFSAAPGKTDTLTLHINTGDARPIALAPYRLPDRWKDGVQAEIEKSSMVGIIEPSYSPWAASIVPVPTPDGSIRMYVDFRHQNAITVPDQYYMPTFDDILERIGGSKVLSKLDLSKGYYQVVLAEDSKDKTTFVSSFENLDLHACHLV